MVAAVPEGIEFKKLQAAWQCLNSISSNAVTKLSPSPKQLSEAATNKLFHEFKGRHSPQSSQLAINALPW